jgi:hypothetical protein
MRAKTRIDWFLILAAGAVVPLSGSAVGQSNPGRFANVFFIGDDPDAGVVFDATSVGGGSGLLTLDNLTGTLLGSNSQLNLYDGGTIEGTFQNPFVAGPGGNIEINIFGGTTTQQVQALSGTTVNLFDGIIATGSVAAFDVSGDAIFNMSGGRVDNVLFASNNSHINISGGSIDRFNIPGGTLTMTGGSIDGVLSFDVDPPFVGPVTLNITGGTVGDMIVQRPNLSGVVSIDGASVTGSMNVSDADTDLRNLSARSVFQGGGTFVADNVVIDAGRLRLSNTTADITNSTISTELIVSSGTEASVRSSAITVPATVDDASLELVATDAGSITATNGSAVLIDGGTIGSVTLSPADDNGVSPNLLTLDIASGDIASYTGPAALDASSNNRFVGHVRMTGGSIGAFDAGPDTSQGDLLELAGGSIGDGARISNIDMSGGSIGDNAEIDGSRFPSEVNIRGGQIGDNLFVRSTLARFLNGTVGSDANGPFLTQFLLAGATFGPGLDVRPFDLPIVSGRFEGNVLHSNSGLGELEIGGGTFLGRTHTDANRVTIYGSDFELNGNPINAPIGQPVIVPERSGVVFQFPGFVRVPAILSGTFLDGTPFSFDVGEVEGLTALLDSFNETNFFDPLATLVLDVGTELVIVNTDPRNFDPFGFVGFDLTPNGLAPSGSFDEPGDEGVTTNDLVFMLNLIENNAGRGDLNNDGFNDFFDVVEALEIFDGND